MRWSLDATTWRKGMSRQEISGAFGDVGILFPLALSLIVVNGLSATTVFLGVGLVYIIAGLYFRIPMPVQPLKAVASIAIAGALSAELVSAAGLLMGFVLLTLSITGAITLVGRVVPVSVVRGIQLTLGLLLMKGGLDLILKPHIVVNGPSAVVHLGTLQLPAGALLGILSLVLLIVLLHRPLLPASLSLLAIGLPVGLLFGARLSLSWTDLGPVAPAIALPSPRELTTAFVLLVLPQLPLSLGNAILSTADVAKEYYGEKAAGVTPRSLSLSMGLANLAIGFLGGMPVCHGAGGLTAHYRLGARTPLASLFIGATCLVLALLFGRTTVSLLSAMPYAILGTLLLYVGWRHLGLVAKVHQPGELLTVLTVAATSMLASNLAVGATMGIVVHVGVQMLSRRLGSAAWPKTADNG